MSFRFFSGDLQASRAQNVNELDTSRMSQLWTGGILLGQSADLPGGYRVSFPSLQRYTGLQVTNDPGVPIIWVAFGLMLGGLIVRLYLDPLLKMREEKARRGVPRQSVSPVPAPGTLESPAPRPGTVPQSSSG